MADKPRRHTYRTLPRFWISLPESIVRRAREDPLLCGLFPSHVGYFPRARAHRIAREQPLHSTIFNYCVGGSGFCLLAGVEHEVRPGDLMVVPSGEPHAYGSHGHDAWTVHWFHAMGTNLPRLLERLGVSVSAPVVHVGRSAELEALFVEVRRALEHDYTDDQLLYGAQALGHLLGVAARLRRERQRASGNALERVRATLAHLRRDLASAHDVASLAELAGLSASRYSELARAATGYPPMDYLTRLRMHRATQLLDTTDLPVHLVAREVGFSDALHFSRVFRRINEQSPRAYRAKRG